MSDGNLFSNCRGYLFWYLFDLRGGLLLFVPGHLLPQLSCRVLRRFVGVIFMYSLCCGVLCIGREGDYLPDLCRGLFPVKRRFEVVRCLSWGILFRRRWIRQLRGLSDGELSCFFGRHRLYRSVRGRNVFGGGLQLVQSVRPWNIPGK